MTSSRNASSPGLGDPPDAGGSPWSDGNEPSTAELLRQLGEDRLWLLRQIDSGRWSEWRLDLAALERELGQLLEQAAERL
ncbi:MAG: hypothetical protein ER33_00380 [Cyanobium sp. CACIAM 14]|nr:MAG: hypothetical protein ER33_00380 [Cyanobium sp. CACIAM 14]